MNPSNENVTISWFYLIFNILLDRAQNPDDGSWKTISSRKSDQKREVPQSRDPEYWKKFADTMRESLTVIAISSFVHCVNIGVYYINFLVSFFIRILIIFLNYFKHMHTLFLIKCKFFCRLPMCN